MFDINTLQSLIGYDFKKVIKFHSGELCNILPIFPKTSTALIPIFYSSIQTQEEAKKYDLPLKSVFGIILVENRGNGYVCASIKNSNLDSEPSDLYQLMELPKGGFNLFKIAENLAEDARIQRQYDQVDGFIALAMLSHFLFENKDAFKKILLMSDDEIKGNLKDMIDSIFDLRNDIPKKPPTIRYS